MSQYTHTTRPAACKAPEIFEPLMTDPDIEKIRKQVEFYFSDSNYRIDTFLRSECGRNDGWIPISTLLSFKRLSSLNATVDAVREALKESAVVEISEDNQVRKVITDEYKKYIAEDSVDDRVIGIRGLRRDMKLEDVEKLLCKHMKPKLIRMRRDKRRMFTGCVLVELGSADEAKQALGMEIRMDAAEAPDDVAQASDAEKEGERIDTENAKRVKRPPACLEIMTKADLLKQTRDRESKEKILDGFCGKIFKYETESSLSIRDVKRIVPGCAFVDTKKLVIRFKEVQGDEEKVFEEGDTKIKANKS
ncbi:UNVERIFIED_CONTAM: hypothetical protein PYX00_011894 [Menopon gallinae]|uniref:HTH La-type RNA-binding domain-containing protein n=1 Tax=Menopon gallinae TaxID=328185 RepID=A0AAW2H8T0_9NEOP